MTHAARDAINSDLRVPDAQPVQEPPSEELQARHNLAHMPYEPWCPSCIANRARADKHPRDFSSRDGSCPTISFDYCYTKAGESTRDADALLALVLVDSKTGYLGCVPLNSKAQVDLATKEIIAFCQTLGYSQVMLRCDNKPSILQIQRLVVQTRQAMGLETKACTPSAYQHGNSLAENAIQRIRGLAGSLMHSLQEKLKAVINSSHALWSWCMRHASWLLNRYNASQGLTSFELVYGKIYSGQICEFGEPVYGFARTALKGNPRWQRMIFLGKVEGQDSYLLYTGSSLILTRSVRRVKTDWISHMAFYKQFNLYSWQCKVGFGGRVVPTKRKANPRSVSFATPMGFIQPSSLVDEDAEAVKAKAEEEKREENEIERMTKHDQPRQVQHEVQFGDGRVFEEEIDESKMEVAYVPKPLVEPSTTAAPSGPSQSTTVSSSAIPTTVDPGLSAPVTPQDFSSSPRHAPMTRAHAVGDDDSVAKKSKTEDHKKQRINRLAAENEKMVRVVQFGSEQYHTMDNYETELAEDQSDDVWDGEDELYFAGIPEELWSDHDLKEPPPHPAEWVDKLADQVEISRLLEMKVLVQASEFKDEVKGQLTTKMVRDWRRKLYVCEGQSRERWMRRSRLVAREFAVDKRDDTYSSATGAHTSNLLPVLFLQREVETEGMSAKYAPVLCSLDIKDAFLQVPQKDPIQVDLHGVSYVILKNLPGQRQGARE